jgi:LAS superfamily LD-carboxypeptidase LdcB
MKKWLVLVVGLVLVVLLATRQLWRGGPAPAPAPPPIAQPVACRDAPQYADAARDNARELVALPWAPFGTAETGWDAYAPVIAAEIGTACAPDAPGFAQALAAWQQARGLRATGRMDASTFEKMRVAWMLRRPFVVATRDGSCPPGIDEARLANAAPADGYWNKPIRLRPAALAAWRRMREAARREVPGFGQDPHNLSIVSGYRSPSEGAARCLLGGCGGPARANCSAHQTGLAMDLYVGRLDDADPTSTADANRSYQAATPLYRWLVRNAPRYGFVGYPYEPWHWEWTGEPVS